LKFGIVWAEFKENRVLSMSSLALRQ